MHNVLCRNTTVALAALLATALPALAQNTAPAGTGHPVVAGFERFYLRNDASAVQGGQLLLGELNCISCHAVGTNRESVILHRSAPVLDGVASRVKAGYLKRFLADPQSVKHGTVMPNAIAGLPEQDRAAAVEALVHFLATTGTPRPAKTQRKLAAAGNDVYHKVGCVACHGTRDAAGKQAKVFATSVPLGDVAAKYTLTGLQTFLANPHATRPSGRMPKLLDGKDAIAVANYLLQGAMMDEATAPNLRYAYYEGNWQNLPDLAKLKPAATGTASGFDLSLARRTNDVAMKFEGFVKLDREGEYRFYLSSDDGSKLWIDDRLVVANDGIHPRTTQTGTAKLQAGTHKLVVGVFNSGGEFELEVEIEGPGIGRQSLSPLVRLTPEGNPTAKRPRTGNDDGPIEVQATLADKGRTLFASIGCANCHQLSVGKRVEPTLKAAPLAKLSGQGGCLDPHARTGVPHYPLSGLQRSALAAAIKTAVPAGDQKLAPAEVIARTMTAFNCYACHERNKVGGVQEELNTYFKTAQPEMGDEGRIPPSLTGAGAKLNGEYLRKILDSGSHDRPYMFTKMPGFGNANVGVLVAMFENADPAVPAAQVHLNLPPAKVRGEARAMIGAGALACIKCHTFAGHKAEGVQGIDMTLMTQRLRKGWFHNYLIDPNKYRPGTRMPSSWPGGQTLLPKYLGGTADKQIEGIWVFLSDGARAALPPGMKKQSIPLVPTKEAIIYRNFIEGAGPRAIAVGYPEQAHLAFDANNLSLALIWQGTFIDAARHWTDRGAGFEPPAGDNVLHLPKGIAFAMLDRTDAPWPAQSARDLPGYQFNGYRVSKDERPTFLYTVHGVKIEDFPNAVAGTASPSIRRTLTLTAGGAVPGLYFRAAAGSKITPAADGWYQVGGELKLRIRSETPPQIRQNGGQSELLVPVTFKDGRAQIELEYQW